MLESVPNFSEGRDPRIVEAIAATIRAVPRVALLGYEMDADHNRSVFTFAGPDTAVVEAAIQAAGTAAALIDITRHTGVHPRVGAADVVPFIPLDGSTMPDAVRAAQAAGAAIWQRFAVPVYLYGEAARRPSRMRLESVRRPGFDGAPPDFGNTSVHPTAGATVAGARAFLIAYNFDLETPDVETAKTIARRIRASSGGFPHVKAMGLYLKSRARAQVTMNLTNFAEIPLDQLHQKIAASAAEFGTSIADGELIGFIPRAAYEKCPHFFRAASNFDESRILETRLAQAGMT